MSSSLGYTEINKDNSNNNSEENGSFKKSFGSKRNSTIKKRPQTQINNLQNKQNVADMLKVINDTNGYESFQGDNDDGELVDFNPPPRPELNNRNPDSVSTKPKNIPKNINSTTDYSDNDEQPITVTQQNIDESIDDATQKVVKNRVYPQPLDSYEGYQDMPKNYSKQYYKNYVPYFNQDGYTNLTSNSSNNKDQLLDKLNYMIHLLEEQKDEKTGHVIEEVILYSFLGIFIIFIVDSFARAGKYTR